MTDGLYEVRYTRIRVVQNRLSFVQVSWTCRNIQDWTYFRVAVDLSRDV